MLSTEKLSMRCVKSMVRCTRICSSATARRGRFMTISSISDVVQVINLVFSRAVACSDRCGRLRNADSPKNSSGW